MKTGPGRDTVIRQFQALEMRRAGASYRQIALCFGYYDHSAAFKAVKRAQEKVLVKPGQVVGSIDVVPCRVCGESRWDDGTPCLRCHAYQNPKIGVPPTELALRGEGERSV